ncbi:MerR family transcriptional regulator [Vallitalea okinawensis]|uniref:MerR family transcriptional regulator n=1 Tax=Vallitalea okinawensis TaxID=2078660 RepID=UPI000CFB29B8|nr:MerR family transcriptional regulator [Vallitalea okinawensis]
MSIGANVFSIGEMSKLHKMSIKTLRYYDEIGLFKPSMVNEQSRYRYYTIEQFERLNTINYLKSLGVPLKDIKEHLEDSSIDRFMKLLEEQQELTSRKMTELEMIMNRFNERLEELTFYKKFERVDEPFIRMYPERQVIRLKKNIQGIHQLELAIRNIENEYMSSTVAIIGKVGVTVALEDVLDGKCHAYNSVFIIPDEDVNTKIINSFPEGEYALIYYRGMDHMDSPRYYEMLLTYIKEQGYEVIGDAMERVIIDQYISVDSGEHLTEIQLPVRKIINRNS